MAYDKPFKTYDEQNQLRRSLFSDYCKLTSLPSNILDRFSKFQQTLS
nr:MAG TPA: hypothetical protein [Caudoviricetes sp.]